MIENIAIEEKNKRNYISGCSIDLVKFKTAQLLFKASNKELPGKNQNMFYYRVGGY